MRRTYLSWAVALAMCLVPARAVCQGGKTNTATKPATTQPGAARTVASTSKADEQTLMSMEREAWEVIKKKDWKAYDRLLTPDFVWIDDAGVIAGRDAVAEIFHRLRLGGLHDGRGESYGIRA